MAMTAAQEIAEAVDEIAGNWIAAEIKQNHALMKIYENEIERFGGWARSYGLKLPVNGRVAAGYLLELAAEGASLPDVTRAAHAIAFLYDSILRRYLDPQPIRAVLALTAAQMRSNRVLN